MALMYHDFYRRKCLIFVRFWFSCTNVDGHLKSQNFKTPYCGCVFVESKATLKISESVARGRSDILINKTISLLLCRGLDCVHLTTNLDCLSASNCLDIATIKSRFYLLT